MNEARSAIEQATQLLPDNAKARPARFALVLRLTQDPLASADLIRARLEPLGARVLPLSQLEPRVLVAEIPNRIFVADSAAFEAAYALSEVFDLAAAEPDLPTNVFPEASVSRDRMDPRRESIEDFPPGCWAPPQPELDGDPNWALKAMRVPEAWAFSEALGRSSRGEGIIIAQPDTGVAAHAELDGIRKVPGFNILDGNADPTDPLDDFGNPGHGTATASVLISPETCIVTGTAPRARHMAIRAIQSVVRVTQVSVAQAIDWAVSNGANVITMSLGGIPSFSLHRALCRAVEADVIVLAAAGNCVKTVVWPARYDDCIAVGGMNWKDEPWRGSCRGSAVDMSAPGENVFRARIPREAPAGGDEVGQGQGTSFAVALTAGVAALWLAHHGRANLVAAARSRGETLQMMFRRLLRATARRPETWDPFEMGAGVVDARALLEADFDLGRDRETVEPPANLQARAVITVKSLVAETLGAEAAIDEGVDWHRFGPEISTAVLRSRLAPPPHIRTETVSASPVVSKRLSNSVFNPSLRRALGLDGTSEPEVGVESPVSGASPDPSATYLRRLVAGRSRAAREGIAVEAMNLEVLVGEDVAAARPGAEDVTGRVEATLEETLKRVPADEVGDPREFRRALGILLRETERAARRLDRDPAAPLSPGEALAFEAVIRTDGTRPSLLVRDGVVDLAHPLAGDWSGTLEGTRERMWPRVNAIGRIEPANGTARNFFGTGWVIDAGKGLVLTNLHVVEAMWRRLSHTMVRTPAGFRVLAGAFIDFAGESGRTTTNPFRVVEATPSGIDGPGFARLDAAVLKIEPTLPAQEVPAAIAVLVDPDGPKGNLASLCVVGFPGPPPFTSGMHEGVDWGWVNATLFGNRFGVKRLAPGIAHKPLGSLAGDDRGWVFGHDPTTLGGSSGAPIFSWLDDAPGAFGLHFAGASVDTNCAHAFVACAESLRNLGVPV